jgi:signal transduction histidine kinase
VRLTSPSLRTRFVGAIFLVVVLLSSGFYFAVSEFIEFLEHELMATRVQQELQEFVKQYESHTDHAPIDAEDMWRYAAAPNSRTLPAPLNDVPPGVHDDVMIDGREFYVGRQDVAGVRLYVGIDMEPVERLEERLLALTFFCIAAGLLISWPLARLLARLVTRPVDELAALVSDLQPARDQLPIGGRFNTREIGVIAAAFDRYTQRVAQLVRREQAFTEDASHDLRSPITVISGAAQLLAADEQLTPVAQRRVQRILRATTQMQRLTEALLFLARESPEADTESCALHELLAEIALTYQESLVDGPVSLHLQIEQPRIVRGPPGMIASLISNLVANAIDHTPEGRIDLTLRAGNLIVQDSGNGIAAEDLSRIFEHGYRGPNSRGFGLGLSLVKRIADRLGWTINVSSELGAGARFELFFDAASLKN